MIRVWAFLSVAFIVPVLVFAQNTTEIESKIGDHEAQIKKLEAEIAQYEKDLTVVGAEKRTLESAVKEIDISRKKVSANVKATQNKIGATSLELEGLGETIEDHELALDRGEAALAGALRAADTLDQRTLLEVLLGEASLSAAWDDLESLEQFEASLHEHLDTVSEAKKGLEESKRTTEQKKILLESQKKDLAAQEHALQITQREKDTLLSTTKQKESNYQRTLEEKRAAKAEFEQSLRELESQLSYTLDPARIPPVGKGILRWPLDSVKITQEFGDTSFARSGAYSGQGHNGVDFRASIGTPIKAALTGVVEGTGNTDQYAGCYSYGKWVLIKHANGLSTLYAHLSEIAASKGMEIATGDIIGYSGNTGYSTGPHLHFTVYASNAVQVRKLGDIRAKTNCAQAAIPVSPLNGYLNPLDYL